MIGTTLALAGARGAPALVTACGTPGVFNLELHAIDFLSVEDGLSDLGPHQRELGIPLARRIGALDAALDTLDARGYATSTLAGAAARWGAA
ncbi:MAG: hypothetical protein U0414_27625 [Polyangiaceae bacterium]